MRMNLKCDGFGRCIEARGVPENPPASRRSPLFQTFILDFTSNEI
jgi:hypothetical protein